MKRIKDLLNNRYIFYIFFSTISAIITWVLNGLFNNEISFEKEGAFLFMLLWIAYPCSFLVYELSHKNKK